jgi:hypothetical protein
LGLQRSFDGEALHFSDAKYGCLDCTRRENAGAGFSLPVSRSNDSLSELYAFNDKKLLLYL